MRPLSHLQTVFRPPAIVGRLSRLLSAACPRSAGKFDEKSGLGSVWLTDLKRGKVMRFDASQF
jgi:hypothetical protein